MYYLLIYDAIADYVERRKPFREEHLGYAHAAHSRGELFMGGALAEPADAAIMIFRGETAAAAEEFARNDPYVRAGLIKKWSVRPWHVAIGG